MKRLEQQCELVVLQIDKAVRRIQLVEPASKCGLIVRCMMRWIELQSYAAEGGEVEARRIDRCHAW